VNPESLRIRTDKATGDLWLTRERHAQPPERVKNITNDVLLNLCADLVATDAPTTAITREVKFSDGMACRITVEVLDAKLDIVY